MKALIDRISEGLGATFRPLQIVRVAKADAKAEIIKAPSENEVAKIKAQGAVEFLEVEERALTRLVHEEGKKQTNIENIVAKALAQLTDDAEPQKIDEDWLSNFSTNVVWFQMKKCNFYGVESWPVKQMSRGVTRKD